MGPKHLNPSVLTDGSGERLSESEQQTFVVAKSFLKAILKHTAELQTAVDADLADPALLIECERYRSGEQPSQPPNGFARTAWDQIADDMNGRFMTLDSVAKKEFVDLVNAKNGESLVAVVDVVAETEFAGLGINGERLRLLFGHVVRQFGDLHQAVGCSLDDGKRIPVTQHPAFWRIIRDIGFLEHHSLLGTIRTKDRPSESTRTIKERAWWLCWLLNEWSLTQRWESWNRNLDGYQRARQDQIALDEHIGHPRQVSRVASLPEVLLVRREYENWQRSEIERLITELFPELLPQLPLEIELFEPITDIDDRIGKYRKVASEVMSKLKELKPQEAKPQDYSPWIDSPKLIELMILNGSLNPSDRTISRRKTEWKAESQLWTNHQKFRFRLSYLKELGLKYPPEWDVPQI